MIRLSGSQATKIYNGSRTVESYADVKENLVNPDILNKVGYYFI
jgi:hypothetical protein